MGQKIAVAGFPGESNELTTTEAGEKSKYSIGLSLVVNEGEIVKLHPDMRNLGHAFFPCLETTADIRPGQSGGPAFCMETLSVVGINSIGGIGGGLVSWVGKALDAELVTPIGLTLGGQRLEPGEGTTLRKMGEAGQIKIYET